VYQDIRQILTDVKENWHAVADRFQFAASKYFYNESFMSLLIFSRQFDKLPKTSFINYNLAFSYYHDNRRKIILERDGEQKEIEIPYSDIVNFIDFPDAKIRAQPTINQYTAPEDIRFDSQEAFDEFIAERPKTFDGKTLRVADLIKNNDNDYEVRLEQASYFDEVRTNLSLDHQLDSDSFQTMRVRDLGDDNNLIDFHNSRLVNTIGVSSVIAFQSSGIWYFHMQPRQKNLGVFSNMLSSVGGNVEPSNEPITDLTKYVTKELKREMLEETGLDLNELNEVSRLDIVPLAFTRELTRGGKPQYFFLTVLGELSEKEFSKVFKNATWKSEFKTDWLSNVKSFDDVLSPELTANLLYAWDYIQERHKLRGETIKLPF
jgi:hypothetical protein